MALLVAVNAALALAHLRVPPATAWVHPVAPPLTRIDALGDRPLAPAPGPPPDRPADLARAVAAAVARDAAPEGRRAATALTDAAGALDGRHQRARDLRIAVQDDAVALAEALGPERTGAVTAARDDLSRRLAEGRVWAQAAERLSR